MTECGGAGRWVQGVAMLRKTHSWEMWDFSHGQCQFQDVSSALLDFLRTALQLKMLLLHSFSSLSRLFRSRPASWSDVSLGHPHLTVSLYRTFFFFLIFIQSLLVSFPRDLN